MAVWLPIKSWGIFKISHITKHASQLYCSYTSSASQWNFARERECFKACSLFVYYAGMNLTGCLRHDDGQKYHPLSVDGTLLREHRLGPKLNGNIERAEWFLLPTAQPISTGSTPNPTQQLLGPRRHIYPKVSTWPSLRF